MAYDSETPPKKLPDAQPKTRSKLKDEDFLAIVRSERQQSVGFEHDNVLLTEREAALNYFKGQMDDMPSLPNRSSQVSTDIADAIETVLPDLIDIFVGGDDVAMFKATSQQDEQAASQETEYVNQVVYQENDGFLILYSMFKDALQSKTGVVKFWWEAKPIKPEFFTGKTDLEVALTGVDGNVSDITVDGQKDESGEDTYSFTLTNEDPGGEVKIMAVPPEDFTVARDTVNLADTTYCAFRTRPRAQDLIAQGIDADTVEDLPPYGQTSDDQVQLSRDTAGEHSDQHNVVGPYNLRTVEVVEHFVRVDADEDGTPELWRILTGGNETMLIEKEQIDRLPFAAITPFIVTHRFYGESIADRLMQIQRIKTALLRMWLDSGYFALNQRHEVASQGSDPQFTIADLLRNEPGLPVRVKVAGSVVPIATPGLGFDVAAAMEYVSTMSEQRTGVVRNAQGLNPDTLHDTAGGMEKLMTAAQKRVRMIARIFAETGVKDMFLGVHALLRKHKHSTEAKVGGQWTPVDCSEWSERTKMTVSIGRSEAEEAAAMAGVLTVQQEMVKLQGGANGPIVTLPNIYAAAIRATEKAGEKDADQFFTDPSTQQPQPPQPNPEAMKAQSDAQQDQAELQAKTQQDQAELQAKTQMEQAKLAQQDKEHTDRITLDYADAHDKDERERLKLQYEHEREVMKLQAEMQIKREEMDTKRADVDNRLQIEQQKIQASIQIALIAAQGQETSDTVRAQAEGARMSVDLELQDREHAHQAEQAESAQDAAIEQIKAAPKPVVGKPK